MSSAVTDGIRVDVQSTFRPERSEPDKGRWLFSYSVRIANQGEHTAQLLARHWVITDAEGNVEEVQGDGVVGQQPRLEPGQHFDYTSFCVLATPHGSMHGTYRMVREDGTSFDARIAPFPLLVPGTAN